MKYNTCKEGKQQRGTQYNKRYNKGTRTRGGRTSNGREKRQ
jgi:hypothetical protein